MAEQKKKRKGNVAERGEEGNKINVMALLHLQNRGAVFE